MGITKNNQWVQKYHTNFDTAFNSVPILLLSCTAIMMLEILRKAVKRRIRLQRWMMYEGEGNTRIKRMKINLKEENCECENKGKGLKGGVLFG